MSDPKKLSEQRAKRRKALKPFAGNSDFIGMSAPVQIAGDAIIKELERLITSGSDPARVEAALIAAISDLACMWVAAGMWEIPGGFNFSIARNKLASLLASVTKTAVVQLASEFSDNSAKGSA